MVRISLHGCARVNVRQFISRLVLGVNCQQTFVLVKLVTFFSWSSCKWPALCCFHSKSIVVTHIKTDRRSGRFDDLLILAVMHAGQNVSAVFWPRYCHTMPPQGNIMGGQVWPQWKSFSCHVSHIHCRGNMYVCMGVQCVRVACQKCCLWWGLCLAIQDKTARLWLLHHLAFPSNNLAVTPLSFPTTWPIC